jgi:hypothetical protein
LGFSFFPQLPTASEPPRSAKLPEKPGSFVKLILLRNG